MEQIVIITWKINLFQRWLKKLQSITLFRLNAKSISKHFDEFEMYINSLKLEFTMIALTETWFDQSK